MAEGENTEGVNVNGGVLENPPEQEQQAAPAQEAGGKRKRGGGGKTKAKNPMEERVRIKLANNSQIPPTGQFIGVNGYGYLLKPGKEADVPKFVLEVLDNAVEDQPVLGEDGRVQGYETAPRFPYTVVRT